MKVLKDYYQWENKKVTEVMKYELGVEIMKEFAWLKPKMCSYIKNNDKKIKLTSTKNGLWKDKLSYLRTKKIV